MKSFYDPIRALIQKKKTPHFRGQSFLELAIVLPVLLIMLLGVVEVTLFLGKYLDMLDLTREAARFASVRDPFTTVASASWDCGPAAAGSELPFDFYYNTACIFSPPNSSSCTNSKFCNGLNSFDELDMATDDIVVTVYSVTKVASVMDPSVFVPKINDSFPQTGGNRKNNYWAYSENDSDTAHNGNWKNDCEETPNQIRTTPYFSEARVIQSLGTNAYSQNKGVVAVELYYCYQQALNIPIITDIIPNPLRIHVYTLMPLPAAQPSATPKP